MVTFRKNSNHNNRRGRFRTGVRSFKRNGEGAKFKSDFSSSANFQRKSPGRNNHNAPKLIEKYNVKFEYLELRNEKDLSVFKKKK